MAITKMGGNKIHFNRSGYTGAGGEGRGRDNADGPGPGNEEDRAKGHHLPLNYYGTVSMDGNNNIVDALTA
jgi:hypothetical protein